MVNFFFFLQLRVNFLGKIRHRHLVRRQMHHRIIESNIVHVLVVKPVLGSYPREAQKVAA